MYLVDSSFVEKGNVKLYADSIIFLRRKNLLKAYGNSILIIEKDTLVGDSLFYNTETENGVAYGGKTYQEKGWLQGKEIYKDRGDTLYVKSGFFTSCDLNPPHYRFKTKKMKLIKNNMAIVKPLILEIHNVPVAILPFWFFPVARGRKSGFMTPRFGLSSSDGKYFKNISYYLVLSNYADITFILDLIEKRGIRGGIDLVYNKYRLWSGRINYLLAQELWPMKRRWSLEAFHKQNLPYNIKLTMRANYLSDQDFLNDYAETKTEWLRRELTSYISLSKTYKNTVINLSLDDRNNLTDSIRTTRIPYISLSLPSLRKGNFRLSGNINFLRERKDYSDTLYTRYGSNFSFSGGYRFKIFKYLRFNAGFSGFIGYADHDTLFNKNVFTKGVSGNIGFSTVLYGKTIFGVGPVQYFIHVFQPDISFSYTPDLENPGIDWYFVKKGGIKQEWFTLNLKNNFKAALSDKEVDLFSLNLGSSYNFLDTLARFSSINFSAFSSQSIPLYVKLSGLYSRTQGKISTLNLSTVFKYKIPLPKVDFENEDSTAETSLLSLGISHSWTKSTYTSQILSFSANFNLTPKTHIVLSASYDLEKGKMLSKNLTLRRDLHCWEATFTYSGFGDRWDYNFRIWIKKLPDVKLEKGLFELFLPD